MSTDTGYLPPLVGQREKPFKEIMEHLRELGYLGEATPSHAGRLKTSDGEAKDAVARYQDFHGLLPDGEAGPVTQFHMGLPRCGLPDIQEAGSCLRKWSFADVTYAFRLQFGSLSAEQVDRAFTTAAEQWNAVCGLNLTKIGSLNNANIWARSAVIDQAGATLAWSYLPNCGSGKSTRLEQRYDTRENWTESMLVAVACHELGHAIGLSHSGGGNLMAPTYSPRVTRPQAGDIEDVRQRYGDPRPRPNPTPPPADDEAACQVVVGGKLYIGVLKSS